MHRFRQIAHRVARGMRQAAHHVYELLTRPRAPSGYEAHLRAMQGELKAEFSAELAFGFHDLQQLLDAKYEELGALATQLKQAQERAVETLAAFDRANTAAEARLAGLATRLTKARSAASEALINLQSEAK